MYVAGRSPREGGGIPAMQAEVYERGTLPELLPVCDLPEGQGCLRHDGIRVGGFPQRCACRESLAARVAGVCPQCPGGVDESGEPECAEARCTEGVGERRAPERVDGNGALEFAGGDLPEVRLAPLALVREQFLRAEPERRPVEIEQQFLAMRRNVARGIVPHFCSEVPAVVTGWLFDPRLARGFIARALLACGRIACGPVACELVVCENCLLSRSAGFVRVDFCKRAHFLHLALVDKREHLVCLLRFDGAVVPPLEYLRFREVRRLRLRDFRSLCRERGEQHSD